MTPLHILIYLATAFTGSTIQAVSGFGFGIFVMTIFPYILPSATCATLSSMLSMTSSVALAVKLRHKCSWKRILAPTAGYFVVSFIAISLSTVSPDAILKKCLAVALILLSIYFLFFSARIKIKPTPVAGLIAGGLSGLLGGFFAMGGPPIVVYLLNASEDNDQYIADIQTYFAITNIYSTAVRGGQWAGNGRSTALVVHRYCGHAAGALAWPRAVQAS